MYVLNASMSSRLNKTRILFLIFSVLLGDQLTKYLALQYLAPDRIIKVFPFFNLVYVENKGTVFGMFKEIGSVFFIPAGLIVTVFLIYLCFKDPKNQIIYSLIIAGALGNIIDRLIYGHVIDFIDLHAGGIHWPAFNIADMAITLGIVLFIYRSLKK